MSALNKTRRGGGALRAAAALLCLFPLAALAGKKHPTVKQFRSVEWTDWQMGGDCTADNTQVIDAGNSVSILLDNFGVQMPAGEPGDGLQARHTCWLKLRVNPPAGRYLDSFRQTYRGGIIKSAKAKARFNVRYQIDTADQEPNAVVWEKGRAIDASSADSLFAQTFQDDVPEKKCGKPMAYGIHLVFTGERPAQNEFVIGGLDSIDADLQRVVVLEPVWADCKKPR